MWAGKGRGGEEGQEDQGNEVATYFASASWCSRILTLYSATILLRSSWGSAMLFPFLLRNQNEEITNARCEGLKFESIDGIADNLYENETVLCPLLLLFRSRRRKQRKFEMSWWSFLVFKFMKQHHRSNGPSCLLSIAGISYFLYSQQDAGHSKKQRKGRRVVAHF